MNTWIAEFAGLRADFLRTAQTRLETIGRILVQLEREPFDRGVLDQLHRCFHNFAGEGTSFGFPQVTELGGIGEGRCAEIVDRGESLTPADVVHWQGIAHRIAAALVFMEPEAPASAVPAAVPENQPLEILIVDEDPQMLQALTRLLEQEGLAVHEVRTRAEAVQRLESRLPDGLITSTQLPDGSGYELVDQIRESPQGHLPAILLIGPRGGILDKAEAIHCGADGYFERPVDFGALIRRLQHLSQRKVAQAGRVLYVEDDREQAVYARAILTSAGYEVLCCEHPEQFEAELAAFQPDLVLMDIMLPGMSGFDLVKYLRQDEKHATLPVIFLTTQGQLQTRIETARVGGDDHLQKPVPPALLISAVAARVERSRFLRSLLNHDGLTRLLTHTAFLEHARATLTERQSDTLAKAVWAMIDIDHFKSVNDRFGHPVGDRVIVSLSALLRRHLRQSDTLGRYGGEEFAIVLDGVNEEEAFRVIDRLRQQFATVKHLATGGAELAVTFSAGLAELRPGMDLESWREAADRSLYRAKAAGRNQVVAAQRLTERPSRAA